MANFSPNNKNRENQNRDKSFINKFLRSGSLALSSLLFSALILLGCLYFYLAWRLPDVKQLKDVKLQVPLRIYSGDGKLIGEFGEKKRIPITIDAVPKQLINAILDTEDQRYFEHPGVDFIGLLRAAKTVFATGRKSQGASTITMQVARNFFLNSDKTYARKLNEIMLALKIDQELSKKEILELYINIIYLGQRAYGVAAAAQVYYGKNLNDLTLPEIASIAGLPQAPSRDNPIVNPEGALERRNHVLERMYDNGHINAASYHAAIAAPNTATYHENIAEVQAQYVAEMVRQSMISQFGSDVYDQGLSVYTTIDSRQQNIANQALHNGVLAYDKRHGYRGTEQNFGEPTKLNRRTWQHKLRAILPIGGLFPAAILEMNDNNIEALLGNGTAVRIPWSRLAWVQHSLKLGDVVRLEKTNDGEWELRQIPKVEAAFVALDPKNGAITALAGGFSYTKSNFNRATQAGRQTGSAFKPFIYSAALDKGFTLASIINDAPITIADTPTNLWRPQNDSGNFSGPTRLRVGLEFSTNLIAIRLLQAIKIPYALEYMQRFGFPRNQLYGGLSLALGATTLSPVQIAAGYATFANGGYKITPYFVNTVKDQNGKIIFQAMPKTVGKNAERTISPQNAFLMTDALKDVISHGTGKRAKILNRSDLSGKTGTTNEFHDGWFAGFNSDLVATVWFGFDQPASLEEHGNESALPIWTEFMGAALKDSPEHTMPQPEGIIAYRINPNTGLRAAHGEKGAIFEFFAKETTPDNQQQSVADTDVNINQSEAQEVDEEITKEKEGKEGDDMFVTAPPTSKLESAPATAAPIEDINSNDRSDISSDRSRPVTTDENSGDEPLF